jgi:hypothetical protein
MKKHLYLFLIVCTFSTYFSKAQNPFKKLGVEVGVITLSKGKYIEFIPYDSIQRIGSVVINIKTGHIIELINTDSIELGYNYRPDVASRWMSPDPLAEEYWDWSPYSYCVNNPIKFIDPNGEEIWIYYGTGKDDRYQYKDNQLYNTAGEVVDISKIENTFVLSTFETLNGLISSGADELGIINTLANDKTYNSITEIGWDEHANNIAGNIEYSPNGGIVTDDNGRQCPALALLHELGHNYVEYYDKLEKKEPVISEFKSIEDFNKALDDYETWYYSKDFKNKDEEYVIKQVETPATNVLKQSVRNAHSYKAKFNAINAFSTKSKPNSKLKYEKRK